MFGHPRGKGKRAWKPLELKEVPGEPARAEKGAFLVRVGGSEGGRVVLSTGPEERPFPELKELDVDEAAAAVLEALGE